MSKTSPSPATSFAIDTRRSRALGLLALLGALSALWALFLWGELLTSRVGGIPFCAFGEEGCAALWDGGFAAGVHETTGMPVAGWGLVWGLVAFLLPLLALVRSAEGRQDVHLDSAVMVTGAAGALGVLLMLAASLTAKLFCSSCAVTYVLTVAYAVVAFSSLLAGDARVTGKGFALAAAATVAAYLVLLYPGRHTPQSLARQGEQALAATVAGTTTTTGTPAPPPQAPGAPGAPAAVAGADRLLTELIANLEPAARQALSDSLAIYRSSPALPLQEPRVLRGNAAAPVRITDFSDMLCGHCAALHQTLDYIEGVLPAGSFSVDSRNFPLDGHCNRHLEVKGPESVRCVASRARICLEQSPRGKEFAGAMFARQGELTPELVRQLAAPFIQPAELERCVASPETAAKLAADVDYAWLYEPDGTPLVLVNGRRGTSFGPFLYALVLTGGSADHPAFATLPPPDPRAHIH